MTVWNGPLMKKAAALFNISDQLSRICVRSSFEVNCNLTIVKKPEFIMETLQKKGNRSC